MKSRIILFVIVSAITTLSFTFVSMKNDKKGKAETAVKDSSTEPVGGFMAEDNI
jgi:hypothetical protein